ADVPPATRTVVERAMARDPAERYPSAADMAAAARAATLESASEPGDTAPMPVAVPGRPRRRRPGLGTALVAAGLVAVLSLLGLLALLGNGRPASTNPPPKAPVSVTPSAPRSTAVQGPVAGTA